MYKYFILNDALCFILDTIIIVVNLFARRVCM